MTLWELEWQRLLRTKRWIALVGVHVFFGLIGPLTARYLPQILGAAGGDLEGATIILPDPIPADGLAQYTSNVSQLGTIVVLVVAAGALAFDALPEMGVFLRTRVANVTTILRPRLIVNAVAAAGAYILGAMAAWYETWALLGAVDVGGVILGTLLGALYVVFAVAVTGAVAQWARSVLRTVMISLIALLTLPLLGIIPAVQRWSPASLTSALPQLAGGGAAGELLGAAAVTIIATTGLVWATIRGAARHEA